MDTTAFHCAIMVLLLLLFVIIIIIIRGYLYVLTSSDVVILLSTFERLVKFIISDTEYSQTSL